MPPVSSPRSRILQSCFWASFTFHARSENLRIMPTAGGGASPRAPSKFGEKRFSQAEILTNDVARDADVLILGAGPAGLSVGFELKQRGLPFLILERGSAVGHSWKRMPTHLKLVRRWKPNRLRGPTERYVMRT